MPRVERSAGLPVGDETRNAGGDLARQSGLSNDDGQQCAIDPLQMRDQSGLDAVPRQPHRTALQQRFGRDTHARF